MKVVTFVSLFEFFRPHSKIHKSFYLFFSRPFFFGALSKGKSNEGKSKVGRLNEGISKGDLGFFEEVLFSFPTFFLSRNIFLGHMTSST